MTTKASFVFKLVNGKNINQQVSYYFLLLLVSLLLFLLYSLEMFYFQVKGGREGINSSRNTMECHAFLLLTARYLHGANLIIKRIFVEFHHARES